ncbi:MAG: hypothetical protein IKZ28_05900 [Clostridia bacterium]|nr:hypothetical protein [Clostridia bacterium]
MEENVYEENFKEGELAAESGDGAGRADAEKKGSYSLGKFKSVDALARAYEALQAEFTRRSQRLKELERKADNSEREGARNGVEKLRSNAKVKREATKKFDEFLALQATRDGKVPAETEEKTELAETENQPSEKFVEERGVLEKEVPVSEMNECSNANEGGVEGLGGPPNPLGETEDEVVKNAKGEEESAFVAKNEYATATSETLYEEVCKNEGVRLKIIGEYLSSIGKSSAPLMTGGAGVAPTPPRRANSVSAAGNMALHYFKKPNG